MKYVLSILFALFSSLNAFAEKAPDFSAVDLHGQSHTLSQYLGKIVVLEWFSPTCPFVKKHYETSNMQKLQDQYTAKGVVWLTVDSSAEGRSGHLTPEEAQSTWKTLGMKSTSLILDAEGTVGKLYGAKTTPHMFVIDKNGALAYQGAIDDQPSASRSTIPAARNLVAKALDELLAGKAVSDPHTEAYGCSIKYKVL